MGGVCSRVLPRKGPGTRFSIFGDFQDAIDQNVMDYASFRSFLKSTNRPALNGWEFGREVGQGAMSRVYCVRNSAGVSAAAKVYDLTMLNRKALGTDVSPREQVEREIELLGKIRHNYVLSIVDHFVSEVTKSLVIVMPYAEGTLTAHLKGGRLSEEELSLCFYEVALAFAELHANGIVHRDLKPDNILVWSENHFLVSDFGVSTIVEEGEELTDTRGSPAFLAPEECRGGGFLPKPADVWAYGITLFNAAFGAMPFNLDQVQREKGTLANMLPAIAQMLERESLVVPDGYAPQLADLLQGLLQKNPLARLTFAQAVDHPWFERAKVQEAALANEEDDVVEMSTDAAPLWQGLLA